MARNTYKKASIKKEDKKSIHRNFNFFKDQKFHLALGWACLLIGIFLLMSFISYLQTGKADQSIVESLWGETMKASGAEVKNWFGLIGARVAHLFIFKWFGVVSLLIPPFLFIAGMRVAYDRKIYSVGKSFIFTVFYLTWTSLLTGYIVLTSNEMTEWAFLSGGLGYELAIIGDSLMGWGTILFIAFLFLVFNMYFFDVTRLPLVDRLSLSMFSLASFSSKKYTTEKKKEFPQAETQGRTTKNDRLSAVLEKVKQEVEAEEGQVDTTEWQVTHKKKPRAVRKKPVDPDFEIELPATKLPTEKASSSIVDIKDDRLTVEPSGRTANSGDTVIDEDLGMEVEKAEFQEIVTEVPENFDPTLDLSRYKYPHPGLLIEYPNKEVTVTTEELAANKDKIVETLINFKIGISSIKATIGPTVTLYEIIPEAGVKISKIKNLEDDIALSLAALGIRIIAPIPGRGTIGIEVPNKNREMVDARSVITTEKFMKSDRELPVVLGKTISNEVFVTDLAKMPHLLMAGATGQGKSVGLNIMLTSLLYKKHPSQLKLVLVDPKKVELTLFNKIERHFLAKLPDSEEAIITDTSKVVNTLNSLCIEMDTRYDLLKDAGCRNIKEYNKKFVNRKLNPKKGHRYLPYIVLVIDELADLMMTAGKEVETPIARLAQLARAIGIHLIVATQRPSVNVITGIIKANFPARLSFRVTSKIDSRTILDAGGAEQLIGMGDMLLSMGSEMTRLQCAFVDTPEVEEICEYIGEQQGYPDAYMLPEYVGEEASSLDVDLDDRDALFDDAARLIVTHQQGSTSLIQRKMKLGYNRAGRIIDQLEAAGIVGPFEGSKAREVLVQDEYNLEQLLKDLNS
jgi:S-DNA-T family DNA segregation ATPase FtsK/SpoIIIE